MLMGILTLKTSAQLEFDLLCFLLVEGPLLLTDYIVIPFFIEPRHYLEFQCLIGIYSKCPSYMFLDWEKHCYLIQILKALVVCLT